MQNGALNNWLPLTATEPVILTRINRSRQHQVTCNQ